MFAVRIVGVILLSLTLAGGAQAAVQFNNLPPNAAIASAAPDPIASDGPQFDSFIAGPGGHVDTVQLLLDTTGDVGGVVNVGIYDDNAGQPSTMLAASVGQVHDSQLSGTASVFTFSGLGITTLTAGDRYWLELSDPNAGLANASGLEWYYAADASGINVGTEFSGAAGINSGLALPNGDGTSSTSQPYMMCISSGTDNVCRGIPTATPEPATLGILGIGLAALGLLRRRRSA